jgi:hypothetical protein
MVQAPRLHIIPFHLRFLASVFLTFMGIFTLFRLVIRKGLFGDTKGLTPGLDNLGSAPEGRPFFATLLYITTHPPYTIPNRKRNMRLLIRPTFFQPSWACSKLTISKTPQAMTCFGKKGRLQFFRKIKNFVCSIVISYI